MEPRYDASGVRAADEDRQAAVIGVLALQGAFAEHLTILSRLASLNPNNYELSSLPVRTREDLEQCDALVIPGGESTTIASVAARSGMLDTIKEFCRDPEKPVWGTCAGCILLAAEASAVKKGGQELFGGVSIGVARNGFGSQLESFEIPLQISSLREPESPFVGVFIRAPIIERVLPGASDVEILARLPPDCLPSSMSSEDGPDPSTSAHTIVALRQGRKMVTTFHPELTKDDRLHEYFVRSCVLRLEKAVQ